MATELKPDHRVTWLTAIGTATKLARDLTPLAAIRAKCRDCCCGSFPEVTRCTIAQCPLYPYRFGRRPVFEGIDRKPHKPLTADQLAKLKAGRERKRQEIDSGAKNVVNGNGLATRSPSGDSEHHRGTERV